MCSEFEREVNSLIKPWHPQGQDLGSNGQHGHWTLNREVVIRFYKKFWSRIEAVVDASGDFIK
jgi:hypothetical protein